VKVGDLVKRKRKPLDSSWVGLVVKIDAHSVWIRWVDDGSIDDCSRGLMEVIGERR